MHVDVNQAWSDVQTGGVDRAGRGARIDRRLDGRDLAAGNRDVADAVDAVARVDDVSAAQQQVVPGRRLRRHAGEDGDDEQGGESSSAHHARIIAGRTPNRAFLHGVPSRGFVRGVHKVPSRAFSYERSFTPCTGLDGALSAPGPWHAACLQVRHGCTPCAGSHGISTVDAVRGRGGPAGSGEPCSQPRMPARCSTFMRVPTRPCEGSARIFGQSGKTTPAAPPPRTARAPRAPPPAPEPPDRTEVNDWNEPTRNRVTEPPCGTPCPNPREPVPEPLWPNPVPELPWLAVRGLEDPAGGTRYYGPHASQGPLSTATRGTGEAHGPGALRGRHPLPGACSA